MSDTMWKEAITLYDPRRNLAVAKNEQDFLNIATEHFIACADKALARWGHFAVGLSGGSTPKRIFQQLTSAAYRSRINWEKVLLFWSDERAVPPEHPDSNYHTAMTSGFSDMPIPAHHIFRMRAEIDIEANAKKYEQLMYAHLPDGALDLVMLGMGDDGHTASLFPHTHALESHERLVVANYVPKLHSWRMTLTFEAINKAKECAIYVTGMHKAAMVKHIFSDENHIHNLPKAELPIDKVGTAEHPALWILDAQASSEL